MDTRGNNSREQLLDAILATYLDDAARGQAPAPEALLARYPEFAGELANFLADREQFDRLAGPLRVLSQGLPSPTRSDQFLPDTQPDPPASDPPSTCDAPPTVAAHEPSFPQRATDSFPRIAGYEVLEEIGRGGMGIVYKARQQSLKRLVALKMMQASAGVRPAELARFRAEAEAVAQLRHPNVVQIHEVGDKDGCPYFCLELLEGGSLHKRLAGAPLQPKAAAALVLTLARAMHYAHQSGIIHRDLKPANILLVGARDAPIEHCVPKVSDFGLAKRIDSEVNGTRTGEIVGTPSYMAPEQAQGRSKQVGPAADIYALGAILYELLTGRPPFKAATPLDTVLQVLYDDPLAPSRLVPAVSRDLETICLKCLQKEPHRRYASALALAEDLERFLRGEPIHARPTTMWERALKWARRHPARAALWAIASAVPFLIVALLVLYNLHLEKTVSKAQQDFKTKSEEAQQIKEEFAHAQRVQRNREHIQQLLADAQAALSGQNLDDRHLDKAEILALQAKEKTGDEPALADLRGTVEQLLADTKRFRRAREKYQALFHSRDNALLELNHVLVTGLDSPGSLMKARQVANEALAVFEVHSEKDVGPARDPSYNAAETEKIALGCYELLLVLAETHVGRARRSPKDGEAVVDRAEIDTALRILDRASQLAPGTQVYHRRRARYLALRGDQPGARAERAKADARPVTNPLDHFLVGLELREEGNHNDARRHLEGALQAQPDLFWARFFLALHNLKHQQRRQAESDLTICIFQRPEYVWNYVIHGFIEGELGNFEAAAADFDKAWQLRPDERARYVLHINRGVMRVRRGQYEDAVRDFDAAIALQPQRFMAYLNLASAHQTQHDREQLLHHLLALAPGPCLACGGLAFAPARRQKLDDAVNQLTHAIGLKPDLALLALLYRERAQAHLRRMDRAAALRDFQRAIAHESRDHEKANDYIECGLIHVKQADYEKALEACDDALALVARHPSALRLRGELCLKLARFEEALLAFDFYRTVGPPLAEVFEGRAIALGALRNYAAVPREYDRALALRPKDANLYTARGWAYLVNDAPKLAAPDFEQAIRLDPHNGPAYTGLGFALAKLGRPSEGVEQAVQGIAVGRPEPRTFYTAARVYAQAASALEAGKKLDRAAREQSESYLLHAVDCLTRGLNLIDSDKGKAEFWQSVRWESRRPGDVLYPLVRNDRFRDLAWQYDRLAERLAEEKQRPAVAPK